MIKCFSTVIGHKQAQDLVIDLNQMKSDQSDSFYIKYDKLKDYYQDNTYTVIGNVTEYDWNELNLDMDFLEADLI